MSRPVVVVEAGQGDRVGNVEFLARSVDTPFFNLGIVVLRPGQGVESHVHDHEDDSFLVQEGTLTVTVGDDSRELRAGPGTYVLVPSGTAHALHNAGPDDVRFLNVHAPGGFDRRIGLKPPRKPRRIVTGLAVALTVLVLGGVTGGPASAAGMTKAKVQQIAASVLARQAPTMSVAKAARAATADRAAVAGNAEKLDGKAPSAYVDRVAFGEGASGVTVHGWPVAVVEPVRLEVPAAVGYVHITGVSAFRGGNSQMAIYVANDTECQSTAPATSWSYGSNQPEQQSITLDRVMRVEPGAQHFVLCAMSVNPTITMSPSLVVETVALGATAS